MIDISIVLSFLVKNLKGGLLRFLLFGRQKSERFYQETLHSRQLYVSAAISKIPA